MFSGEALIVWINAKAIDRDLCAIVYHKTKIYSMMQRK